MRSEIVVPASVSNLGPGFDALAVAVQLYLRLRIVAIDERAGDDITMTFVGAGPLGENRIESAFRLAQSTYGIPTPGLRVEVQSDIPQRAGLGSSAAAAVAGLKLYEAVTSPRPLDDWLALAARIEGHPDNAAAALLGGLAASCQRDDGCVSAQSWRWPEALQFVVATPHVELETGYARSVLPPTIPLRDAVFNLQHALLFLRALETGRYSELREAMRDRWHQPVRSKLVPALAEVLALDHPAVLGACLAGSGPSVVVLTAGRSREVAPLLQSLYDRRNLACTIRTLGAHQPGPPGTMKL